MTNEIERIASKVLGKTSDGSTMARYETPNHILTDVLVAIPRHLNRTQYDITEPLFFKGYDVWHSYEFSTLLESGVPIVGCLKIKYPADSENIVESKSLKLYLNSFNMVKIDREYNMTIKLVEQKVRDDLSKILNTDDVSVKFIVNLSSIFPFENIHFSILEHIVDVENIHITDYQENESLLKVVDNVESTSVINIQSSLLRSNCRVTNQPDWGDIFISYKSNKVLDLTSLLRYIVSMRAENHFHEEICECFMKRLYDLLEPEFLMVSCLYTRRGGIDINPIRWIGDFDAAILDMNILTEKTLRQ